LRARLSRQTQRRDRSADPSDKSPARKIGGDPTRQGLEFASATQAALTSGFRLIA
jgi:hypothetical protein